MIMVNEKRLIDAKAHHLRVSKILMSDIFPDWKELPRDVQEKLTKLGKEHERLLFEAPTVDAVEVVHSWWEKSSVGYKICHHCKANVAIFSGHKNYCPNCGAKMDGDGGAE